MLLHLLGSVSLVIYVAVLIFSFRFGDDGSLRERPILVVLALLAGATLVYFAALATVTGQQNGLDKEPPRWRTVLMYAILFRLVLLPSLPIQETDYYRYLWDGQSLRHGFNPYRYSPLQVEIIGQETDAPPDLAGLHRLSQQSPALQTIFQRVHHRAVPTVYPPAAQVVFAAAALATPITAPLWTHLLILKLILSLFDLGTVWLLASLLRLLNRPRTWALAYAWCPLTLKEISNSGHLDTIAIFFTVLMAYWLVRATVGKERPSLSWAAAALAALGIGVLAKSYPLLLIWVVAGFLFAHWRWRAFVPLAAFGLLLMLGYLPFWHGGDTSASADEVGLVDRRTYHPGSGLQTFLTRWEINDLIFMVVHENLRWPAVRPDPWFVVVPQVGRQAIHDGTPEDWTERLPAGIEPSFILTQLLLGLLLWLLCLRWAWTIYRGGGQADALLRGIFLTLAVGWLVSSAQNPWYLLWSLPFMLFAGGRSWFLLTGLALIYYVRFWMEYQAPDTDRGVTDALAFFDYTIVWLEYTPFFLAILAESLWQRRGVIELNPSPRHGATSPQA